MMVRGRDAAPPWLAERLLGWVLPRELDQSVVGDLREEWVAIVATTSVANARRWYWREALSIGSRTLALRMTQRRTRRRTSTVTAQRGARMDSVRQDLRFATRVLARRPTFTTVAIATLALGIGAATTIFTVVDAVVLRPLAYRSAERLVRVHRTFPDWRNDPVMQRGWETVDFAYPEFRDWRAMQRSFEDLGVWVSTRAVLAGAGDPEEVRVSYVSASLFPMLGAVPALGRAFLPGEDTPTGPRLAIVSHATWRARFGGDTSVIGRMLTFDGVPRTVVGVAPRDFRLLGRAPNPEYYLPAGQLAFDSMPNNRSYSAIARLRPGVGLAQAQADVDRFFQAHWTHSSPTGGRVFPALTEETKAVRTPLLLLGAAAGLLLLLACANVATLLLGEATARDAEIATRIALGAGWHRVARQLLTEHLLLAASGAALGLLLAYWSTKGLLAIAPENTPRLEDVSLDGRAVAFAVVAAFVTSLLFGLAPLLTLIRVRPGALLHASSLRATRQRTGFQRLGIVLQLAVSVVLLVGGVLVGRTLAQLSTVDPGFRPSGLLYVQANLPRDRYENGASQLEFHRRLIESVAAMPGVTAASAGTGVPFADGPSGTSIVIARGPGESDPLDADAQFRIGFPGMIETLGIRLLMGRTIQPSDGASAPPVALVNEAFVRRFWPTDGARGKRIRVDNVWRDVVGVVGDVKHGRLERDSDATFYLPAAQTVRQWGFALVVRTTGDPAALVRGIRARVRAIDPTVPIARTAAMDDVVRESLGEYRFRTVVIGFFAIAAWALAAVGVYGMAAGAVGRRVRELAIRMSLGATHASAVRLLVRSAVRMVIVGVGGGVVAAALGARALRPFLYGVTPTDRWTYAAVAAFVVLVALVATWLPARRATRIEPAVVLRSE
jgi:predicted permease